MRVFRYMYTFRFILLTIQTIHIRIREEKPFYLFIPFYSMILMVSSFAFCFVKNDWLTIRAVLCQKRAKMPVCMVLVELTITCVHDYMVVPVKVTKIYGK